MIVSSNEKSLFLSVQVSLSDIPRSKEIIRIKVCTFFREPSICYLVSIGSPITLRWYNKADIYWDSYIDIYYSMFGFGQG